MRLASLLLLLLLCVPLDAQAARNTEAELEQVRQEKQKLVKIRKQLESKLGVLGKELRRLDRALVKARTARRKVDVRISETDKNISQLRQTSKQLKSDIIYLEEQMIKQSIAAYQKASRQPGWLDIFAGVDVSEIPHRKKMLQFAMLSQEKERLDWQNKIVELAKVEKLEISRREELVGLKKEKKKKEKKVAVRVDEKRNMTKRVRRDVGLKKEKERQLAAQEKALQNLLKGLSVGLLGSDKSAKPQSVRKRKGRLSWPLKGKIVASFGSRPVAGRPRLTGVQLSPSSKKGKGRQVKAIASGQVRYSDWFGGYGLMMIVDHGDGLISVYAHNDALYWQMGDWIEAGELLAEAGSTGWIEGIRLYFELRDRGKPVNPKRWCRR
ncbi:MAG: peptidoglycan DD-metalloendopeptidase family protein [Mariprofundaceae bacterium]